LHQVNANFKLLKLLVALDEATKRRLPSSYTTNFYKLNSI